MFRCIHAVGAAVVLAACAGSSGAPATGDGMGPDEAGSSMPDGATSGSSSGGSSSGGSSSGGHSHDAAAPNDSGGGPVDATSPPYDGPPGQFVYGPPSGTSGLPGLLSSVQIVTVTWTADTEDIVSQIATAFTALDTSAWWGAVSSYCVPGASTCVGKSVTVTATHVGDPPGQPITDSAIMQTTASRFPKFVADKSKPGIGGKPPDLPTPVTASTLYVFFMPLALPATSTAPALPQGYAVTVDGAPSCGYHSATVVNGLDVAYAVIPRCPSSGGQSDVDVAIAHAFQEIADAVTDPFRAEGRLGFNSPTSMAAFEIGDFCPGTTTFNGFEIPQLWSNQTMGCAP